MSATLQDFQITILMISSLANHVERCRLERLEHQMLDIARGMEAMERSQQEMKESLIMGNDASMPSNQDTKATESNEYLPA